MLHFKRKALRPAKQRKRETQTEDGRLKYKEANTRRIPAGHNLRDQGRAYVGATTAAAAPTIGRSQSCRRRRRCHAAEHRGPLFASARERRHKHKPTSAHTERNSFSARGAAGRRTWREGGGPHRTGDRAQHVRAYTTIEHGLAWRAFDPNVWFGSNKEKRLTNKHNNNKNRGTALHKNKIKCDPNNDLWSRDWLRETGARALAQRCARPAVIIYDYRLR